MTRWTHIVGDGTLELALACCKGPYQRDLVRGYENLSGSSLAGKAKQWGAQYARSRSALIERMREAGLLVSEITGHHNRRELVIAPDIAANYAALETQ